jgi:hypothetical protein
MPEITFTVDMVTGKSELTINGIPGKKCELIHGAVSADLAKLLGVKETNVEATPDKAKPEKYTTVNTATARR